MASMDPPQTQNGGKATQRRAVVGGGDTAAVTLQNQALGPVCRAIENVIDTQYVHEGVRARSGIITQSETSFRMICENYGRLDSTMLTSLRRAIPDANYHFIEVLCPCAEKQMTHTPIAISIQVGTTPPVKPDTSEVPPQPTVVGVTNLRKFGIPETLELTVQRLLTMLTNGGNTGTPTPLRGVRFSKKHSTLIVEQPPTYSYDFLMSLFSEFQRVLEDFRFEVVSLEEGKSPTTVIALQLRDFSTAESGGYVRGGRTRSFLSRFNPFA